MTPHTLSSLDKEKLTANCITCGPVAVYKEYRRRQDGRANGYRYRCFVRTKLRYARKRAVRSGAPLDIADAEFAALHRERTRKGARCPICQRLLNGDGVLDHSHKTGKARGVLCGQCNTGLGMFADDIARIQEAIAYLAAHSS